MSLAVSSKLSPLHATRAAFSRAFGSLARQQVAPTRLIFDPPASSPAQDCARGVAIVVAEHVARQDWLGLSNILMAWDQARTSCPANRRLVYLAMDALGAPYKVARGAKPKATAQLPDRLATHLAQLARRQPDNYVLAALAAQMRIWQAWDYRGSAPATCVDEAAWARTENAIDQAAALVAHLDPVSLNAPLVGCVQFNLLPFEDDGARHIHTRYQTRMALDPADLSLHRDAGRLLLPRWFGDYETLETTARQAAVWTAAETRTAAYAAVYAGAFAEDTAPLCMMSPDMFAEGCADLICLHHHDPAVIVPFFQTCWHVVAQSPDPAMPRSDAAHFRTSRAALQRTLARAALSLDYMHVSGSSDAAVTQAPDNANPLGAVDIQKA